MSFSLSIPNLSDQSTSIKLKSGFSTFFVGANGSGKTRLATQAESQWGEKAHRISAHRSLSLNPNVAKISEQQAISGLRFGDTHAQKGRGLAYREGSRWRNKAETWLLNDFDFSVRRSIQSCIANSQCGPRW